MLGDIDDLCVDVFRLPAHCFPPNVGEVRAKYFVSIDNIIIGDGTRPWNSRSKGALIIPMRQRSVEPLGLVFL
jgi:hypothetical protein